MSTIALVILVAQLAGWAALQFADLRHWAPQAWRRPAPRPLLRAVIRLASSFLGFALAIGAAILLADPLDRVYQPLEGKLGGWASLLMIYVILLLGASVTQSLYALKRRTSVWRGWLAALVLLAYATGLTVFGTLLTQASMDQLQDDPLAGWWLVAAFLPLLALTTTGLHFGTTPGRTKLALYLAAFASWALRCLAAVTYAAATLQVSAELVTLLFVELCVITLTYLWSRRLLSTTNRALRPASVQG